MQKNCNGDIHYLPEYKKEFGYSGFCLCGKVLVTAYPQAAQQGVHLTGGTVRRFWRNLVTNTIKSVERILAASR